MSTSRTSNHGRWPGESAEEGAALITALLAILVTAMFAIVMLGVLLSQMLPTRLEQATTRTVFAAEAGVNAVASQIRNAEAAPDATGKVYGKKALLPCTASGKVSSGGSEVAYEVTVRYYREDPTGQPASWRSSSANLISCSPGFGPAKDPSFALIESRGMGPVVKDASGDPDRAIEVVYAFQVTNTNIPGGYIFSFNEPTNAKRFCLEATSTVVGANIKYVAETSCGSKNLQQLWIYDKDYRIKLAATTVPTFAGDPLCITATPSGTTPVKATLEKCLPVADSGRWNQLWSWDASKTWKGENSAITDYANFYLGSGSTGTVTAGTLLYGWNSAGSGAEWGSFDPAPAVGAGPAGKSTNQIVNYLEFGRCADVTGEAIGAAYMISYPCKQDPSGGTKVLWNHKWYYDEPVAPATVKGPQQIKVINGSTYCLWSPGTEGGYVRFYTACTGSDKHYQWTRTARTGDYSSSYTFTDGYGRCLDLESASPYSKLITKTCNASLSQKWNAEPNPGLATLGGYWELS